MKWQGCPVMPVLARFRPDLLKEAEAVGDNIRNAILFIKKYNLCDPVVLSSTATPASRKCISREVRRTLRDGS